MTQTIPESPTPVPQAAPQKRPVPEYDLDDSALYLNRELTWLAFNKRVLNEADQTKNPLLERVKFLAIVSSNLDEFFMKRIGGLKQQVAAGVSTSTIDGRTPQEQLTECHQVIREIQGEQQRPPGRGVPHVSLRFVVRFIMSPAS